MLINDHGMLGELQGMIWSLTREASLHDDMMQEALVHLWRMESERPNQSKSWYIQGCRFQLLHYLHKGRSLDSFHRRSRKVALDMDEEGGDCIEQIPTEDSGFDRTHLRDLFNVLSQRLTSRERAVLECLAEGCGATETAQRVRISTPTVRKDRRTIARWVAKLEPITFAA